MIPKLRAIQTSTGKVHAWTGFRDLGGNPVSCCGQSHNAATTVEVTNPETCRKCIRVVAAARKAAE